MRLLTLLVVLLSTVCSADTFILFEENGKVGMKTETGTILLPAAFDALGWSDGSFSVIGNVTGYRLNNKWGIINLKKEFITQAVFQSLEYGSGEYIIARKQLNPTASKVGCLNLKGDVKINFQYDGIQLHELRAIVFNLQQGKYFYGLTDLENHLIIPVLYKQIYQLGTLRYAVQNQNGKIALFTENGKAVTDFTIDSISSFKNNRAIVYQNLNQGLLDREGSVIVEPTYKTVRLEEDKTSVLPHNEWFLITSKNQIRKSIQADGITLTPSGKTIFSYSHRYGLLDSVFSVSLPAQYEYLHESKSQLIATKNNKQGVITSTNQVLIPFRYDSIHFIQNQLARVYQPQGWQLASIGNTMEAGKVYTQIGDLWNNYFPVNKGGYWGLLNAQGTETIHCVFDSLLQVKNHKVVVKFKNQFGIVSDTEDWLVPPQQYPLHIVNDSCYIQQQGPLSFIKRYTGEILYFTENPVSFESTTWSEQLPDGSIKVMNYSGTVLSRSASQFTNPHEQIFEEHEGMRGIKRDGKFGFIDARGRLRVANRYDGVGNFQEGLAPIKLIGKWGFINAEDKIIINPNYEQVSGFKNDICLVQRNGKWGIINREGKYILTLQYDSLSRTANDKIKLFIDGRIGLANKGGSILIEPRFESLQELETGMVLVSQGGKSGVITSSGLSVIPVIYDSIIYSDEQDHFFALKKAEWKTL